MRSGQAATLTCILARAGILLPGMHVEHFMTKNPVACEVDTPIVDVAAQMRDKGVGSVIVLRNGKVAGIITDRQIVVTAVASGDVSNVKAQDVMTENPATLTLDDNLFSVIDTFRSAGVVRRAPVVNEQKELIGVVSVSDVAVIARDLIDGILLEETHNALEKVHVLTGAKRVVKDIRRPTKTDRLPPDQEIRPVTTATPPGPPGRSGGAGDAPRGSR